MPSKEKVETSQMTKTDNYEGYDDASIQLIENARKLYKQQINLCEEFILINGELRYDDFWTFVFDTDPIKTRKCETCGVRDNLKPSYFKSWSTSETKKVMTCSKCFWGKKFLGNKTKKERCKD